MNLLHPVTKADCRRLPRDESKIKSYDSCSDVRAWSHDGRARDLHLREWMKRDMPISILPISTLACLLRSMTRRSRARTTPRCHPDCKSKVLLESICTSCEAIKSCLRSDPKFDKYFAEEEFETSHWPCDRCLEVLKSIKMFWKIILERIFGINLSKVDDFDFVQDDRTESVKSVAKLWEKEIAQQASFVKNVTPLLSKGSHHKKDSPWTNICTNKSTATLTTKTSMMENKPKSNKLSKNNGSPTGSIFSSKFSDAGKSNSSLKKSSCCKLHKCTSFKVQTDDVACECHIEADDLKAVQNNLQYLKEKCNEQGIEIEQLKVENNTLKMELRNYPWKYPLFSQTTSMSECDKCVPVPKPFESCIDDAKMDDHVECAESEMIITMKNCRNETFKQVSLLQVLHKTNDPILLNERINTKNTIKENPVELLTKVHDTFGEMVKREIYIVNNKTRSSKHSHINATFHSLNPSRSAPSCSTLSTESSSSNTSEIFSSCAF